MAERPTTPACSCAAEVAELNERVNALEASLMGAGIPLRVRREPARGNPGDIIRKELERD